MSILNAIILPRIAHELFRYPSGHPEFFNKLDSILDILEKPIVDAVIDDLKTVGLSLINYAENRLAPKLNNDLDKE